MVGALWVDFQAGPVTSVDCHLWFLSISRQHIYAMLFLKHDPVSILAHFYFLLLLQHGQTVHLKHSCPLFYSFDQGFYSFLFFRTAWEVVGLRKVFIQLAKTLTCSNCSQQFKVCVFLLFYCASHFFDDEGHFEDFLARWPHLRTDLKQTSNHRTQVLGILLRNAWIDSSCNFLVQPLHVFGPERRLESDHLIQNATQWPYIGLRVVGFILPNLRAGVVRSPCLGHT